MLSSGILCFGKKKYFIGEVLPLSICLAVAQNEMNQVKQFWKPHLFSLLKSNAYGSQLEHDSVEDRTFYVPPSASSGEDGLYRHRGTVSLSSPPKGSITGRAIVSNPRVGYSWQGSLGALSPVLHPWLLKICLRRGLCWKQGVFLQQIAIYSN